MMISFEGAQFPKDVILFAVFFYLRYTVSYRDLEEIMAKRGVTVDHVTLNRWVAKFSPVIASTAQRRKAPVDRSWRMYETYIKVNGEWVYLYRAVDKLGRTLDFMLSKRRNRTAASKFFARAFGGERPAAKDRDRPKRSQHRRDQRDKSHAEVLWMPDPDSDAQDQVSEQHGRTGSPYH